MSLTRLLALALLLLAGIALGEAASRPAFAQEAATDPDRARRQEELRSVEQALAANADSRRRLEAEIAEIRGDRAKLGAALLNTADHLRATEERVATLETRLGALTGSETAIRRSIEARRGVIVEVLAVLQRMGRRPPPAVLARPEDMLEAVRASMLLGAVLPELRGEVETLAADLSELVRLKSAISGDRDALRAEFTALVEDRVRLDALVRARQARLQEAERTEASERERSAALAQQSRSLKELIERSERELTAGQRAAEEARRAAEAQAKETRERFAALAFKDPARLAPKIPFQEAKGALPRPVTGEQARGFGEADGLGGTTRGISITTRPKSAVVSPADGWVAFAGPFRSFGRLLIINAGGGYYLLLAGMDQINVEAGQFVLAGEPVAVMGETSTLSAASGAVDSKDPVLYVEFRKDGGSIDPGPWWAKSQSEKVRG